MDGHTGRVNGVCARDFWTGIRGLWKGHEAVSDLVSGSPKSGSVIRLRPLLVSLHPNRQRVSESDKRQKTKKQTKKRSEKRKNKVRMILTIVHLVPDRNYLCNIKHLELFLIKEEKEIHLGLIPFKHLFNPLSKIKKN